jgi:hypothetical protein
MTASFEPFSIFALLAGSRQPWSAALSHVVILMSIRASDVEVASQCLLNGNDVSVREIADVGGEE